MLDSVLSPNKSVSNQVLGSTASPRGSIGLDNSNYKQQELSSDNNSNPEDDLDKENAPTVSYEKDDKLEINNNESDEEPTLSEASPKRSVEEVEVAEGSPDGCNKKARTENAAEATNDIDVEPEVAASPPKTSTSKKSVDDLLADLAKSKDALGKSKETLKLLKEQQQKLVDNGASMTSRFHAFDEELKQLKEKHAENGKDLEKVLSIRDSARASFKSAEETLQKINSSKSQIETTNVSKKVAITVTNDIESWDPAADDEEKNDETAVTATEEHEGSPDCLVEAAESKPEEFIDSDPAVDDADEEIVETNTKEQGSPESSVEEPEATKPEQIVPSDAAVDTANQDDEVDATTVKEQENLESPVEEHETKEEGNVADNSDVVVAEDDGIFENKQGSEQTENEAFETSRDDGPEEVAEVQASTASFETPFDEKSEEGKENLDFIDDEDADTESDAEGDTKEGGEQNASGTATIDDTLALELQNTDENDSDGDSLISM